MKLKEIPISDLKISRLNMRHGGKAPDVSDILPSIRENGLFDVAELRIGEKDQTIVRIVRTEKRA